jgi:quinol monooxygenase YgiN
MRDDPDMSASTFTPDDDVSSIVEMFRRELVSPDQSFTLRVRFQSRQGADGGIVDEFERARGPSLRDRGCLAFELDRHAIDRRRFVIHERWQTLADLEAHLRRPHAVQLRLAFEALIDGTPAFEVSVPTTEWR